MCTGFERVVWLNVRRRRSSGLRNTHGVHMSPVARNTARVRTNVQVLTFPTSDFLSSFLVRLSVVSVIATTKSAATDMGWVWYDSVHSKMHGSNRE